MDDGPNCIFDAGAQRGMTDCSLTSYHLDSGSQARGRAWATAQQPTTTQDQGATTRKGPPPPPAIIAQRATTSLPRYPHQSGVAREKSVQRCRLFAYLAR